MKPKRSKKIHRLAGLAAIISAPCYVTTARAQNVSPEDVQALVRRINELEQKVKTLEQQHDEEAGVAATNGAGSFSRTNFPTVLLGANGLIVRSPDTNFVMIAHGYVQAEGRFYEGAKTTPDEFLFRRVRPIVEGTVWQDYDYRLMLDVGSGNTAKSTVYNNAILDDAYVNARFWPEAQFQVGKYKAPIGLERLQSTADLMFVETGFATELTPNYDLGAEIHNSFFNEPIGYSIGIFNGATDGGSDDADADSGKDVEGRIFAQPFLKTGIKPLQHFGFGVAGSVGDHYGSLPSYTTMGQQTFFSYASGVTADGQQYRVDPQAYYYWGPFGLEGEYVLSSQAVAGTIAGTPRVERFNNTAWQLEGSYFLTGEDNSFKYTSLQHVTPNHPLRFGEYGWGAFELVARVQQMSLDNSIFGKSTATSFATSASAREALGWTVGVNWYLNSNVKLNLDYDSTTFRGGSSATGSATKQPEHVILSQVQFMF